MTQRDPWTLGMVAADPAGATFRVAAPQPAILQPLAPSDESDLAAFFEGLSDQTRRFYSVTDPQGEAHEHVAAIARYDKLRLILRTAGTISAIVEFSFDLTPGDVERFASHGVPLCAQTDCRWGLCVADEWQGRGVGVALAPPSFEVALQFGRDRIILLGGVHKSNAAAIRYYRKVGFAEVGQYTNEQRVACIDMIRGLDEDRDRIGCA
jgi:GNAT superfamily N-acetyltransferase